MRLHFFVSLVWLVCSTSSAFAADHRPYLMGAIGDSISAAALAHTRIDGKRHETLGTVPSELPSWFDPMGIIDVIENKLTLSWASGVRIESHYWRLKQIYADRGQKLDVLNAAVSGDESKDLTPQIARLVSAMRSGKYAAMPYLTFFIGANDLCDDVSPETVRENVRKAYDQIASIRQGGPIRILATSVPKIPDLALPPIKDYMTGLGYTCSQVRDRVLRTCRPMLGWETPEGYQAAVDQWERTNAVLRAEAEEANRRHDNLDVVWGDSVRGHRIRAYELAGDCFHPNSVGQMRIAEELWQDQPWFR